MDEDPKDREFRLGLDHDPFLDTPPDDDGFDGDEDESCVQALKSVLDGFVELGQVDEPVGLIAALREGELRHDLLLYLRGRFTAVELPEKAQRVSALASAP